ncbi:MAG: TRL-like family protein [Spirochaetaceae bacterium]|jgi:hypothetical protein|nr:TRL-like family protein [Spirochaetaceae bacterium]
MTNKKVLFMAVTAAVCLLSAGCAAMPVSGGVSGVGTYYSSASATKRGEATNTVLFKLIGVQGFPPAGDVARDNGISKIATIEHYSRDVFFSTEYTTIVTGE